MTGREPLNTDPPAVANIPDPNAGAGIDQLQDVNVQVAGGSNLYIGDGAVPAAPLYWFGEQMDDTAIVTREFFNDVPGDSNGGPQGPPIERQVLGRIVQLSINLSTWNQRVRYWVERQNSAYSTNGAIYDYEVGTPILQAHRFRLLIVPARSNPITALPPADKSEDWFCFNFPTILMSSPIECSQGTKFSALSFTLEAHRGPAVDDATRGVLWNRDVTGLDTAVAARQAEMQEQFDAILAAREGDGPVEAE
jgi:hypothetical protein